MRPRSNVFSVGRIASEDDAHNGESPEETLKSLLAVAQSIIQVCKEDGQELPPELTPLRSPEGILTVTA